jgi:hypothetical protein
MDLKIKKYPDIDKKRIGKEDIEMKLKGHFGCYINYNVMGKLKYLKTFSFIEFADS